VPLMRTSELRRVVTAPSVEVIEIEVEIGIVQSQKSPGGFGWRKRQQRLAPCPLHWPGCGLLASGHGGHACG
jgi:hypothetical protein